MCEIQSQNNGDIRIVCVEKRTGKLNIFFPTKMDRKEDDAFMLNVCSDFWPPFTRPPLCTYIFCVMLFSILIQKSRKCGKKPSKYMSERYIYMCGCRP